MNPKGLGCPGNFSWKQIFALPFLVLLAVLVAGCPHNEYTVELKPTANGVERSLTFYRVDGSNSNGTPNYLAFPSNELAAITRVYPPGAVRPEGQQHIARGEFSGPLPKDVGGAGSFKNCITSLGEAGFYLERFRGNDDLAGPTEKRFHAADQIADLVIGWTKAEFGGERGYKKLRKFLDEDFRSDLKNAGLYFWVGQVGALNDTNAAEEFTARFSQYFLERGYLKLSDAPRACSLFNNESGSAAARGLLKRLTAEKMEIPTNGLLPKALAIFDDSAAFENSWERYLARSSLYRAKLKDWNQKRKTDAKLEAPKPINAADDLIADLFGNSGGESDHLTVKLTLNQAPNHTNGKWQDGRVIWDASLDASRPLPALCYASWSQPDRQFQETHFGRVLLDGDELMQYCLWENGLSTDQAREWKTFLSGLQRDPELKKKLEAFRLVADGSLTLAKENQNQPVVGCQLLLNALGKEPASK
jgi:hypothetical protein